MDLNMAKLAIVGGTGLSHLEGLEITHREVVTTPYGQPSGPLLIGEYAKTEVVFLARHGERHTIPPHKVNYRANLWALRTMGVKHIVAVAAVGGMQKNCSPRSIVIPNQIIDYTYDRAHTFFEGGSNEDVQHIDFSWPYSRILRGQLLKAAIMANVSVVDGGVYGATQGPRLETAAEIRRMIKDGCTIVGMTGMPEAALACELELDYVCCAVVANWAAGLTDHAITMSEIEQNLKSGLSEVKCLLTELLTIDR